METTQSEIFPRQFFVCGSLGDSSSEQRMRGIPLIFLSQTRKSIPSGKVEPDSSPPFNYSSDKLSKTETRRISWTCAGKSVSDYGCLIAGGFDGCGFFFGRQWAAEKVRSASVKSLLIVFFMNTHTLDVGTAELAAASNEGRNCAASDFLSFCKPTKSFSRFRGPHSTTFRRGH